MEDQQFLLWKTQRSYQKDVSQKGIKEDKKKNPPIEDTNVYSKGRFIGDYKIIRKTKKSSHKIRKVYLIEEKIFSK